MWKFIVGFCFGIIISYAFFKGHHTTPQMTKIEKELNSVQSNTTEANVLKESKERTPASFENLSYEDQTKLLGYKPDSIIMKYINWSKKNPKEAWNAYKNDPKITHSDRLTLTSVFYEYADVIGGVDIFNFLLEKHEDFSLELYSLVRDLFKDKQIASLKEIRNSIQDPEVKKNFDKLYKESMAKYDLDEFLKMAEADVINGDDEFLPSYDLFSGFFDNERSEEIPLWIEKFQSEEKIKMLRNTVAMDYFFKLGPDLAIKNIYSTAANTETKDAISLEILKIWRYNNPKKSKEWIKDHPEFDYLTAEIN